MDGQLRIETDLVDFQILEEGGALPFDANPYLDVLYVVRHGARHADGDALPILFAERAAGEFAAVDPFLVSREHAEKERRAAVVVVAEADIDGFDHDAAAVGHAFFDRQVKRHVLALPVGGRDLDGAVRFRDAFLRNAPACVAQRGDAFRQGSLEDGILLCGGDQRKRERNGEKQSWGRHGKKGGSRSCRTGCRKKAIPLLRDRMLFTIYCRNIPRRPS